MPQLDPDRDGDLSNFLEPGQLAASTARPIPRADLSRPAHTALWTLRLFALIITLMVIYTFITQLR